MGLLDFLISDGKQPHPNTEYIYSFYLAWRPGSLESIKIPLNTIVNNVSATKNDNGKHTGYNFTIKGTEEVLHCNYPWAFIENNRYNSTKLKEVQELDSAITLLEKQRSRAFNLMDTLEPKVGKQVKVYYPFPLDNEIFDIIEETDDKVKIQGDFSAGTHNVCQSEWIDKEIIKEFIVKTKNEI